MGALEYEAWSVAGPLDVPTPGYEPYGWVQVRVPQVAAADAESLLVTAKIAAELASRQLLALRGK